MRLKTSIALGSIIGLAALATWQLGGLSSPVDYNTQVKPILNKYCISCHGGVKSSGGFSLMTREDALQPAESGKLAIVPGHPELSEMISRLLTTDEEERMPYEKDALPKAEIKILKQWIKEGAKWDLHWAYRPLEAIKNPASGIALGKLGNKNSWAKQDIDYFILKKLKENHLQPSPIADKATLLRRVSLDLIGMPASEKLAQAYLQNDKEEAFEQLIDSLLASPHFGERWAAVWLDLARYADTKGYERDDMRTIWQYRDYVIKAFNQDMPYDQFLIEQLAGDLLPNPTDEQYIATGFHRNSTTNDEGGTDNEEFRIASVLDRVNTTWEVLMGTTFACVQCHGHPYDPLKHEEYYQFLSFFNNTRDEDTYADYPWLRNLSEKQVNQLDSLLNWASQYASPEEVNNIKILVKTWQPAHYSQAADKCINSEIYDAKFLAFRNNGSARLAAVDLTNKNELIFRYRAGLESGTWQLRLDSIKGPIIATVKTKNTKGKWVIESVATLPTVGVHDMYFTYQNPKLQGTNNADLSFDWLHFGIAFPGEGTLEYRKYHQLFWDLLTAPTDHTIISIENPMDMRRKTRLFDRGSWLAQTQEVTTKVPSLFEQLPADAPQNRLGLAMWMTNPEHPLTARTWVNRIWEQMFGKGLVETLEDMGTQGSEPTHRELLDYLAWQLTHDYEWSLKRILKQIVLSATYQQASTVNEQHLEKDPLNLWYARAPRVRLSAEQVRDQTLVVSGLISRKMYGPSVMPDQPKGIWSSPYNGAIWQPSVGEDQYRRGLYTFWKRSSPYPSFITFDATSREVCVARRLRTNTPLQALVSLNDPVYIAAAKELAKMMSQEKNISSKITLGYQRATGQAISQEKKAILEALYMDAIQDFQARPEEAASIAGALKDETTQIEVAALTIVANVIMNLDEFITKS